MAETETRVLTAHIPVTLLDELDAVASRLERSRSWIMKQALSAWLRQEEERDRLTRLALTDVEAGHVISHRAWVESLATEDPSPLPR